MSFQILIEVISDKEKEKKLASEYVTSFGETAYLYTPIPVRYALDYKEEFGISLNFLVSDVRDITSKQSSYSKTILIPATPGNIKAFGFISENASDLIFNPKNETKCYVVKEGITVFDGYLRVNGYNNYPVQGSINYSMFECTLASSPISFLNKIYDKKMIELNYGSIKTLPYNAYGLITNWQQMQAKQYPAVYYPIKDYGWNIPWKSSFDSLVADGPNGIEDKFGTGITAHKFYVEHFYPQVQLRALILAVFMNAGFKVSSEFLDSPFFREIYMDYSGERFMQKPDVSYTAGLGSYAYDKYFYVGQNTNMIYNKTGPFTNSVKAGSFAPGPGGTFTGGLFAGPDGTWSWPLSFNKSSGSDIYQNITNKWVAPADTAQHYYQKNIVETYKQRFKLGMRFWMNASGGVGANDWEKSNYNWNKINRIYIKIYRQHNDDYTDSPYWTGSTGGVLDLRGKEYQNYCVYDAGKESVTFDTVGTLTIRNYNVLTGAVVPTEAAFDEHFTAIGFDLNLDMDWIANLSYGTVTEREPDFDERLRFCIEIEPYRPPVLWNPDFTLYKDSYLTNEISLDVIQGNYSYISIGNTLPKDLKVVDFINDMIDSFNLYIEPKKDDATTLVIEPRDDFYAGGKILDWSNKINESTEISHQIIAENNKNITFALSDDTDYLNKTYKNNYKETYGSRVEPSNNFYASTEKKIQVGWAPSPLMDISRKDNLDNPNRVFMTSTVDDYTIPSTLLPTVDFKAHKYRLNFGCTKQFNTVGRFATFQLGYNFGTKIFSVSWYPYAGEFRMFPDNWRFQNYFQLVFDSPKALFIRETPESYAFRNTTKIWPTNNLYTTFWKNAIADITDKESRLVTMNVYLDSRDINNMSLRDRVFIRTTHPKMNLSAGAYFLINKIEDYDPVGSSMCKVELLMTKASSTMSMNILPVGSGGGSTTPGGGSGGGGTGGGTGTGGGSGSLAGTSPSVGLTVPRLESESKAAKSFSVGSGNVIDSPSMVMGNGNYVPEGLTGVRIIGDNIMATMSNVTYTNVPTIEYFNIINAGRDEILNPFGVIRANVIDGGRDVVRPIGSDSVINIINGGRYE